MILKEIDIKCSMLPIPFAFHTKHIDAISASLDDAASGIELRPLQIPTLLGAKGKILPCGEVVSSHKYFSEHCRNRVKFTQGLEELHQEYLTDDSALWIEVGPHGSTLPMIRSQTSTTAGFYAALEGVWAASLERILPRHDGGNAVGNDGGIRPSWLRRLDVGRGDR